MPLKQKHPRECQMSQDRRHHHIYKEQDQTFGTHSGRITYFDIITNMNAMVLMMMTVMLKMMLTIIFVILMMMIQTTMMMMMMMMRPS